MQGNYVIEKYKKIPLRVRASMWFFICSVMQKMISVVSTAIFTRVMTTGDYGLVSIYNSWADILLIVASLNLHVGCFNVGMTKYEEDREVWVSSLQILSLISAVSFSVVFLGTYKLWGDFLELPLYLCIVMAITFFFNPAINLWTAKQRYTNSYRELLLMTIGFSLLNLILPLILVLNSEQKGEAKIIASSIVVVFYGIFLMLSNIREACKNSSEIYNKSFSRFAFKYNLQMMPAFLSTAFMGQIDRIMIDRMIGRDEAAIYSVAYNVASMISIVSSAINATYNPWMMQRVRNKNFNKVNEIGISISFFLLLIIEGFIFLAPEAIKIFAPSEYYEAIYIIPAVAGSTFFNLIYGLYSPIAQYQLKVIHLMLVNVLAGVVNIGLNYYAIEKWGYIAAGYTTFISYFIYGFVTALFCLYILRRKGTYKLYDLRILSILILILAVTTIVAPLLYKTVVLRYIILLIVIIYFVIKKDKILNLLRVLKE